MKVLVTRPEDQAAGTAATLAALGHEPVLAPCITISKREVELPAAPAAVILTSGQAIPALPERFRDLPAFCVGDMTAARLRLAGFTDVESAAGDADDLFRLVAGRLVAGPHLLAVGTGQGIGLARRLGEAGIEVQRREVYDTHPATALPPAALAALAAGEIGAALFYAAGTAEAFARLRPPRTERVTACAISRKVAAALADLPWRAIHVALAPNEADVMALLHE